MFKGFREFVLRGNVVDMAVGVVIGAAFGSIVTAFVKDLLTPLIAALVGKPDFSAYSFEVNGAEVSVRRFSQCGGCVPVDRRGGVLLRGAARERADGSHCTRDRLRPPDKKTCPECLSEIPIAARKCAFCTSPVA